jgi:hypothetical protein
MILGVCGLAGSGKDTTADILVKHRQCVKVSLADPLKRICREVFDFTDEQLWGPSEKRNAEDKRYLRADGKEGPFNRYTYTCEACGQQTTFGPREALCCKQCGAGAVALGSCQNWREAEPVYLTPRFALQQLGTEWGRHCYDTIWVDYALRVAKQLLTADDAGWMPGYDSRYGLDHSETRPNAGVVIPDVRFRNEVKGIKAAGGKVIRVVRPGSGLKGSAGQHQSETEQLEIPDELFDFVIFNVGTLEALEQAVLRGWEGMTTGVWPPPSELEEQTSAAVTPDMLMGRSKA